MDANAPLVPGSNVTPRALRACAIGFTRRPADIDDLMQAACEALLRNPRRPIRGTMQDYCRSIDFLGRAARHRVRRGEESFEFVLYGSDIERLPAPEGTPEAIVSEARLRRALYAAIERLPKRERELVKGFYFCGRSQQDFAQAWGVCTARVCQILRQAEKRLAHKLRAWV